MTALRRSIALIWLAIAALAVVVLAVLALGWVVDALWYGALGRSDVFWRLLGARTGLFLGGFAVVFGYLLINFRLVAAQVEMGPMIARARRQGPWGGGDDDDADPPRLGLAALGALPFGLIAGGLLMEDWDILFRFLWGGEVGVVDPLYGRDVGFFLFSLPFLDRVQGALTALFLLGTVLVAALYGYGGRLDRSGGRIRAPGYARWHLWANASLFLLGWGAGHVIAAWRLVTSPEGAVFGAGYADATVTRPGLFTAAVLAVVAAAALAWAARAGRFGIGGVVIGGYAGAVVVLASLAPAVVQSFVVKPNELELETPYLEDNIAFTRRAYGLDAIRSVDFPAREDLSMADLRANQRTVDNIRLWDWRPLSRTFRQLQQIRTYYEFHDVDVDRYPYRGGETQMMLAARELSGTLPGGGEGETWLNRHLQYTHGYGLAMSLAGEKDEEGTPILVVKDLPPVAPPSIPIRRPAIYYGETMTGYRVVATGVREFDYPRGDDNVYTRYDGHGGVPAGGLLRRTLFALHFGDISLLLSDYIRPDSRIQFRRPVQERVRRLAPFLRLDRDPYLVAAEGRLFWVQDAYTTATGYPYAEPFQGRFNYIRNAVKVVVDAYHGDVTFFMQRPDDPVLGVYRMAFPGMFRPMDEMPEALHRHIRYPQDLFEVVVDKLAVYHMTVPQVFYNREDVWTRPREKYGGEAISMEPYYLLMTLPGAPGLEFLMMTPVTPAGRDNMIAWIAARSDPPNYGETVVYKLPKERLIRGPIQVEATIDQDTIISRQLSLWDQRGSRVIRGNLLVIPIAGAFLYVEPVYLLAEGTDIPQLKRVIVSDGRRLAMEPTLAGALKVVFGGEERAPEAAEAADGAPAVSGDLLPQARSALQAAQRALARGDWAAFGRRMDELGRLLTPKEPSDGAASGEGDGT